MNELERQYGNFQNSTSWYKHAGENNAPEVVYLTLGLVGEAGEFADAIKKIAREVGQNDDAAFLRLLMKPEVNAKLVGELGDVMWYFNKLLLWLGVNHSELMIINTLKLYSRLSARPHSDLTGLEWPFELSYEEAFKKYECFLEPDKDKDGV